MKHGMYVIWDHNLELYSPIYIQRNAKLAIAGFESMINDPKNVIKSEYTIYECGTFDDENYKDPISKYSMMIEVYHVDQNAKKEEAQIV